MLELLNRGGCLHGIEYLLSPKGPYHHLFNAEYLIDLHELLLRKLADLSADECGPAVGRLPLSHFKNPGIVVIDGLHPLYPLDEYSADQGRMNNIAEEVERKHDC